MGENIFIIALKDEKYLQLLNVWPFIFVRLTYTS